MKFATSMNEGDVIIVRSLETLTTFVAKRGFDSQKHGCSLANRLDLRLF